MVEQMPMAYVERGGKLVIRASALGSCTRALVAAALGYEEARHGRAEEIMSTAAGEGNLHEEDVINRLEKSGYVLVREAAQAQIDLQVIPGGYIRGHIDGFMESGPGVDVSGPVEVKTMSKDRFADWTDGVVGGNPWRHFSNYAWQISAYMYYYIRRNQINHQALYAVKDRNSGKLDVRVLDEAPIPWPKIRRKMIEVLKWVTMGVLPPCDPDITPAEQYFCPFIALHEEEEVDDPYLDDVTAQVVANLARQYHELTEQMRPLKKIEARRREVSKEMKRHIMGKRTQAGEYTINRVQSHRKTTNTVAAAADLGLTLDEFQDQYTMESPFEYFTVKKVKPTDDKEG